MKYYIVLDDGTTYGSAHGATLVAMQDDSLLQDLPAADGRDVIAHGDKLLDMDDLIVSAGLDPDDRADTYPAGTDLAVYLADEGMTLDEFAKDDR